MPASDSYSPVAFLFHGHYRTVVGADKNTKEKDPMGVTPDATYRLNVSDMVKYIHSHPANERSGIGRGDISISYLKDLDFEKDTSRKLGANNSYQNGKIVSANAPEFVDPTVPKYGTKLTKGILKDETTKFEVTENAYYPHHLQRLGHCRPIAPAERIMGTKARTYEGGMSKIGRFGPEPAKNGCEGK